MLRAVARSLLEPCIIRQCAALQAPLDVGPVAEAAMRAMSGLSGQRPRLFAQKAGSDDGAAPDASPPGGGAAAAAAAAAEAEAADASSSSARDAAELEELLAEAQEEAAAFKDRLQRAHAEMQNLIARQNREKETLQTYAVQKFAESLLDVADNLESAARAVPQNVLQEGADVPADTALKYLRSLLEGVQATERTLLKTMGSKGVQRIQTAAGDDFDPNTMEAMSTMPCPGGDAKPGAIANVWQSGYKIHDRILRAAKVIVYQE